MNHLIECTVFEPDEFCLYIRPCHQNLIKPQFEAGREKVGKKGVVRDPDVHLEVIDKIVQFSQSAGFSVQGLDYSPVKGPEGNIEYLIYLKKSKDKNDQSEILNTENVVIRSHKDLNGGD